MTEKNDFTIDNLIMYDKENGRCRCVPIPYEKDMAEKRFENRLDLLNPKFNTLNPVWDNEKGDALNVFEMIGELNYLNDCCNNLIEDNTEYVSEINQMHKENEQLKRELTKFKEWKKHIGDVKREELDRVFKMSIYEIAGAFEYYEERIKKMEEELQEWSDEDESCGHCKHLQIDGMFGMWCDKGRNWQNTDANYCSDYER